MVNLTLTRSDSLYEGRVPQEKWDAVPEAVTLGPFEYVELTFQALRVGPEGEQIGEIDEDCLWYLVDDPYPFSDLAIHAASAEGGVER